MRKLLAAAGGATKWQVVAVAALGLVAVLLAPVVLLTLALAGWAWWRGWSPTRARYIVVAVWLVPLGAWVAGSSPTEQAALAWQMVRWQDNLPGAWIPLAPWLLAVGVTNGVVMWALRWNHARSGVFDSPRKAGIWLHRLFQNAMRRCRREVRRPWLVPMLTRRGDPVLGRAAFRTEAGAGPIVPADPRLLTVPMSAWNRHIAIVGEPGAGKTVLITRAVRGWTEAAWLQHIEGAGDRPLPIVVDCKGGADGRVIADRLCNMVAELGLAHGRVGRWTGDGATSLVRLDLWTLPAERLIEVLVEMIRAAHPFYDAMRDELVYLAVCAPKAGPPVSSVDFVSRLNGEWLTDAWVGYPRESESIRQNAGHFAGIAASYAGLFRRLGRSLDSGRRLDDFDALICTLEGTANARTAAAQAQALMELVTDLATRGSTAGIARRVLLVIDEFSAISDRVDVTMLMERCRSLGVAVVPAGQSWTSLGPTDDDRTRLLSAAAGGALVMGTTDPDRLAALAGSSVTVDTSVKMGADEMAGGWDDGALGRVQRARILDPDWLRMLEVGQVAYATHGTVTWGVVAPVETTDRAPALIPGEGFRRAVEARRTAVLTVGDRIPIGELEAGLTGHQGPAEDRADPLPGTSRPVGGGER